MKHTKIDIGNIVLCDLCNKDWTESPEKGGFIFLSKAVCPDCSPNMLRNIEKERETRFITAEPNEEETFYEFICRFRQGPAEVNIYSF